MSFNNGLSDKCILIVDDSSTTICVANRILSAAGFRNVRSVEDPRNAEQAIEQFNPDLILVDVIMPFVDGMAVLQSVKHRIDQGQCKVIMLSAIDSQSTIDSAIAHGASLFLKKPFEPESLVAAIEQVLGTNNASPVAQ